VRYLDPAAAARECDAFRRILDEVAPGAPEAFLTAPSPGIIARAVKNQYYDSDERYIDALAEALRVEYEAIVARGFVLQLDCPDLALERHITYAERPLADFMAFVETVVGAINRSLRDVPRQQVRLHVCWGNYEGPHDADVPMREILPAITQANVGGIVLPFANPRHAHEYRLFENRALADDQVLVAGVIDTTTNYVEHPEVVAQRLEHLARALGDPSRVIAGTDCGFDTSAGMGRVAGDVVWAKLAAMTEGAALASQRLFAPRA
jgi:5-methyltetrahydropteroyltriglutamate--homocysteine methyltransferase